MSLHTDEIIDACQKISQADPGRDKAAEEKLKEIGKILHDQGGMPVMQNACFMANHVADNPKLCINALCNSCWDGIGEWER